MLERYKKYVKKILNGKERTCLALMYHRIGQPAEDFWGLSVSPVHFQSHLEVFKNYTVISTDQALACISGNKKFPKRALLLTFDDGYADNYEIARPLLQQQQMPATFFITTGAIGCKKEFWWDALEHILFHTENLPKQLELTMEKKQHWEIPHDGAQRQETLKELFFALNTYFKQLDEESQKKILHQLEDWSGNKAARAGYLPMSLEQLKDLSKQQLFTLGAHTQTHPFLPHLNREKQALEIQNSINQLTQWTGKNSHYFAYPHGGRNIDSLDIMKSNKMKLAFTTEKGGFSAKHHPLEIPRVQITDQPAEKLAEFLANYFKNSIL